MDWSFSSASHNYWFFYSHSVSTIPKTSILTNIPIQSNWIVRYIFVIPTNSARSINEQLKPKPESNAIICTKYRAILENVLFDPGRKPRARERERERERASVLVRGARARFPFGVRHVIHNGHRRNRELPVLGCTLRRSQRSTAPSKAYTEDPQNQHQFVNVKTISRRYVSDKNAV